LKGKKERIAEDLTWREGKIRWNIGGITRKEMAKGKRVWIKGREIRIEGQWWRWNDDKEILISEGGSAGGAVGELRERM